MTNHCKDQDPDTGHVLQNLEFGTFSLFELYHPSQILSLRSMTAKIQLKEPRKTCVISIFVETEWWDGDCIVSYMNAEQNRAMLEMMPPSTTLWCSQYSNYVLKCHFNMIPTHWRLLEHVLLCPPNQWWFPAVRKAVRKQLDILSSTILKFIHHLAWPRYGSHAIWLMTLLLDSVQQAGAILLTSLKQWIRSEVMEIQTVPALQQRFLFLTNNTVWFTCLFMDGWMDGRILYSKWPLGLSYPQLHLL